MRSAEELDAELRRTRRSLRRLMVGMTLGIAVGLGLIVTVVGATLAVVDKRATEMLVAPTQKANVPARTAPKVEQVNKPVDAPRSATAQAPAVPPPAPAQSAAANPPPAPSQTASQPPPPVRTQAAANSETKPAPARPVRDAKRPERDTSRVVVTRRTSDETDGAAPRDDEAPRAGLRDGNAPRNVSRGDDVRDRTGRRVVRMRPADQDEAEAPPERVTIIQRPGYARPQQAMPPVAADEGNGPRRGGLFGFIFGQHGDDE